MAHGTGRSVAGLLAILCALLSACSTSAAPDTGSTATHSDATTDAVADTGVDTATEASDADLLSEDAMMPDTALPDMPGDADSEMPDVTDMDMADTTMTDMQIADLPDVEPMDMAQADADVAAPDAATLTDAGAEDQDDTAEMDMAGMDMTAADTDDPDPDAGDVADDATPTGPKLGFGSQMDGKIAVFDLDTLKHYADVGDGHSMVHGCGVSDNQTLLWYANPDTQKLDRYQRGATPAIWTKTKTYPAPFGFGQVKASANGGIVAVSNGQMVYSIDFSEGPQSGADKFVAFDTVAESWFLPINVKNASLFDINADGSKAYIANRFDHKVVVVQPKTGVVEGSYDVLPQPNPSWWYGPAEVALSPDGKWLVATNLELGTFSLFDTDNMLYPTLVQVGKKLHSTCFSPDGERIFVQYLADKPSPKDELGNAMIASSLLVYDRKSLKYLGELLWTWSSAHVQAPPWGDSVFMSASFSAVVRYSAKTLQLTGEQVLMPGMPMPLMSIRF